MVKISSILSVMLQFGFFAFHLSKYRQVLGSLSMLLLMIMLIRDDVVIDDNIDMRDVIE